MNDKPTILYVDDEPDNLISFYSLFRKTYHILTAEGGKKALELIEEHQIQLLLSDHKMPEMSGLELCGIIMQKYPDILRIIVTGYSELDQIHEAIHQGKVAACIKKPWNIEELENLLERNLL